MPAKRPYEPFCPCGQRLATRAELLATGSEMDAYIAGMLTDDDAYCVNEDDVVPREFWRREAEVPDDLESRKWWREDEELTT